MFFSLSPFAPENLVSRDGFGSPVPRQPAHLHKSMYGHHIQQSMDQPGKVANPARGQLNTENEYFPLSPFAPENLVSRTNQTYTNLEEKLEI